MQRLKNLKMTRRSVLLASAVTATSLAFSLPAAAADTIKIGLIASLSGPSAKSAEAITRACIIAASGFKNSPPSEKLSGVMFKIPMIRGRSSVSPPKSARGADSRSRVSASRSARLAIRDGAPRVSTSTCENQVHPPAKGKAPFGRAGSLIAMGR